MREPADIQTQTGPQTRPRGLRRAVLAISAIVAVTAAWGVWVALTSDPQIWGLLGFEVVTLVAAGFGVAFGLGRPREAPGLTVGIIGATIFAAATLGRFSAIVTTAEDALSGGQAVVRLVRDPVFDGRLLAALALGAITLLFGLDRDRAAWRRLVVGAAFAVPVLAAAGWLVAGSGIEWILAPSDTVGGVLRVLVVVVGGIGMAIFTSIAAHQIIVAFEGRLPVLPGGPRPMAKKPHASAAKQAS